MHVLKRLYVQASQQAVAWQQLLLTGCLLAAVALASACKQWKALQKTPQTSN
jgi:hypothetical protein